MLVICLWSVACRQNIFENPVLQLYCAWKMSHLVAKTCSNQFYHAGQKIMPVRKRYFYVFLYATRLLSFEAQNLSKNKRLLSNSSSWEWKKWSTYASKFIVAYFSILFRILSNLRLNSKMELLIKNPVCTLWKFLIHRSSRKKCVFSDVPYAYRVPGLESLYESWLF